MANLLTVMLVGLAISLVRLRNPPVWYVLTTVGLAVLGLGAIAFGNFLRRSFHDDDVLRVGGWILVGAGSLGVPLAVLVLTGLASRVK